MEHQSFWRQIMGKKELNPATFSRVGEYDSFGVGKSNIPVHSLENSLIVFDFSFRWIRIGNQ